MAVGRISGPLLKDNLLRDGVNLAFETDLLYIDVINGRVGIKTTTPSNDFTVNGTTRTTNLEATNSLTIGQITASGNTLTSSGQLNLVSGAGDTVVYQKRLSIDNIDIYGNNIIANTPDTNLEFAASGTGQVRILSNTFINGNLHATGNITADGNIQLGDQTSDLVSFNADIASDLLPDQTLTYNLGNASKRWNQIWAKDITSTTVTMDGALTVNGVNLVSRPGNSLFVSTNGSDTQTGTHPNDAFRTLKQALTVATAGTTIFVYAGTYTEIFPLTIPAGVTVKGAGIRSVTIQPTVGTIDRDAFLMNGETTVEDLTITGFRYNSATNNGHAFRFASNMVVTSRSPYIRNVTVITSGSVVTQADPRGYQSGNAGRGAYIDGAVVNASSKEASMLFHSCTFITPGIDCITMTNGVRVEWLNCFTYFAFRGLIGISGNSGFGGTGANTYLRLEQATGPFFQGETLTYYDTDGTTVLATGVVSSVASDGKIALNGKPAGWQAAFQRAGKPVTANGNAKLSTAQKKFGSASLYLPNTRGNVVADGWLSVQGSQDFAYGQSNRAPKTISVGGQATTSIVERQFGVSSILLDGTGDRLSLAPNADFGFNSGDFCIEAWIFITAGGNFQVLADMRTAEPDVAIVMGIDNINRLYAYVNGAIRIQGTVPIVSSTWTHVAISRASGSTRLWANGVQQGTTYTDANDYGSSKPIVIGTDFEGNYGFNGYIDEIRVSNLSRYTATFTPSQSAFTHDSNSVLLIHGDNSIEDDSGDQTLGSFAIEFWYRPLQVYGEVEILFDSKNLVGDIAPTILRTDSGEIRFDGGGGVQVTGTTVLQPNAWYHIAYTRYNGTGRLFINGGQEGSSVSDINDYSARAIGIGARQYDNKFGMNGYIDDVRVSKGVPRYIQNFLLPIVIAANDNYAKLALRLDGTNNSTNIVDSTVIAQDVRGSNGASARVISLADYADYGCEIRSIGSACVYGKFGAVGTGPGVIGYLIGHNFAYIGAEYRSDNDYSYVIRENEVVESSGAKMYYSAVDQQGNFRVGNLFSVNQADGSVTFTVANFNILGSQGLTFQNGNNITFIDGNQISTGNLKLQGNTLSSTSGDVNISAGSGVTNLLNNVNIAGDLDVTGNVTISGNIVIGNQSSDQLNIVAGINSDLIPSQNNTFNLGSNNYKWQDIFVGRAYIGDLLLQNNAVTVTLPDTDLMLYGNGTGAVKIGDLLFKDNEIQSTNNSDINLTPNGTGIVNINSNRSLKIPVGNTGDRPSTPSTGMLRFNIDSGRYEGWNGIRWQFLDGLSDLDGNTRVTAELFPGANDNTIRFYTNGVIAATLTNTSFTIPSLVIDDITINGNSITSTAAGSISIQATGTGSVIIEAFRFTGNNLTSTVPNGVINFNTTGDGYVQMAGAGGFVLPVGTSGQRPGSPQTGLTRFNTVDGRIEVYDGNTWVSAAGANAGLTENQATELAIGTVLALG